MSRIINGDNMKKNLSYLVMSLLFFNFLFIFYYYFKIVSFWYIGLFDVYIVLGAIFINFLVLIFDILYILIYEIFKFYRLSYFKVCIVGLVIGVIMSLLLLGISDKYEFGDYLGIVSYFLINTIFISYSLYFEKEKIKVFE